MCHYSNEWRLVRVVRVSGRHLSIPNYGATGQVRYAPAARPPLLPPPARLSFFAQISNPAHAGHMHQPTTDPGTVWPICRVGISRHRCSMKYTTHNACYVPCLKRFRIRTNNLLRIVATCTQMTPRVQSTLQTCRLLYNVLTIR